MLELPLNLGDICMVKKNRKLEDANFDDTYTGQIAHLPSHMTVDHHDQPTTLAATLPEFPTNDLPFPD